MTSNNKNCNQTINKNNRINNFIDIDIERCAVLNNHRSPNTNANGALTYANYTIDCGNHLENFLIRLLIMAPVIIVGGFGCFLLWWYFGLKIFIELLLVIIVSYIVAGKRYRWLYIAYKTAPRDFRAGMKFLCMMIQMKYYRRKNYSVVDVFRKNVTKFPNKVCFIYENDEWTFTKVEEFSNKVANVFKAHGYRKGDVVGLFLENRPEFVCLWLGLSKLGIIVSLLNSNQRQQILVHSITIAKCKALIFGSELASAVEDIRSEIEATVSMYHLETPTRAEINNTIMKAKNLSRLLIEASINAPNVAADHIKYDDRLLYIYTSGTTGLPKAAVITNSKFFFIVAATHWIMGFTRDDRFYNPLPLYHTAGGCMSIGQAIVFGATVVIRNKFSASSYFPDCRKYECTIGQYIGEMCRYILAVPPKEDDQVHKIRFMYGNGLRPQIWRQFTHRFGIKKIGEFYGATEGNANIANTDNTVGAVGFVSRIIPFVYPISVIKVDEITGEPIRDAKGLCIKCEPGEPGAFVGKISSDPSRAFDGYVDEEASKKKVIYDIFDFGDSAFISGDIMVADEFGYLYFKDRTGDTFRWKGENVSTSEVEGVLSNLSEYRDIVVYGVEVPGYEGKAGMAAILDPTRSLNFAQLSHGVHKLLPSYARPLFLRILNTLEMTGTFKMKKIELQRESFNPSTIDDQLYYLDKSQQYLPLTSDKYDSIVQGKMRL